MYIMWFHSLHSPLPSLDFPFPSHWWVLGGGTRHDPLHTVDGNKLKKERNANWCSQYGNWYERFKKTWKYYKSSSTYHFEQYPERTLSQHSTKAPARSHSCFVPTYWGNVHNSQVMKAAKVPTNRWRDTKCCFISICQRQVRVLVSLKDNFSLFPAASLVLKWGH